MTDPTALLDSLLADDTLPTTPDTPTTAVTLHLSIHKFILRILLDKAATVVPTRDVMPTLKCVHLHAAEGRLRVTATDTELSMICTTPMVTIHTAGTAVFPARKMLDILRQAADNDVTIRVTGTTAQISIADATWTLTLPGGHDFPRMPAITDATFATAVDRPRLLHALSAARYAASRDANRPSLNILDIRNARITACDGSRLQQVATDPLPFDLRIPIAAVDDLIRLLKACDRDTITIGHDERHLIFQLATDVFIVNKVHAAFPDMEALLLRPALTNRHQLTIDRAALQAAIRRIAINADTDSSAIALTLGTDTLTITTHDKHGNAAGETLPANYPGPTRTLIVNHQFLTDALAVYTPPICDIRLGDDTATNKTPLLLLDEHTGTSGVVQQMLADWMTP